MPVAPRLVFRAMTETDLDEIAALVGDQDVMRFYLRPLTRAQAGDLIARNQRRYRDHGYGLWVISVRATGEFVGDCGLTRQPVDGADELEVGYHVRTARQGRGYATEAAAARDFARDVLRAPRLTAIINPLNVPSQRVAEKIGLRPEKRATAPDGTEAIIYAAAL